MPESTPIYGIPYPCSGETVDPAVFQAFADAVDAAISTVDGFTVEALNRPAARIWGDSTSIPTPGVEVAATFTQEDFDNDGMGDLAVSNDRLTVQTAGSYLVTFSTTLTMNSTGVGRLILRQSGTRWYQKTFGKIFVSGTEQKIAIAGLFESNPGNFFSAGIDFQAAGTALASDYTLTARMVNRA